MFARIERGVGSVKGLKLVDMHECLGFSDLGAISCDFCLWVLWLGLNWIRQIFFKNFLLLLNYLNRINCQSYY